MSQPDAREGQAGPIFPSSVPLRRDILFYHASEERRRRFRQFVRPTRVARHAARWPRAWGFVAERPAQQPGPRERQYAAREPNGGPGLLVCSFHTRFHGGSIILRGVARRSFGLVRLDLWLQIDPSALDSELVTS